MSMMYATITSKGQITLPAAARRALGLHEGQRLGIRIEGTSLVIDSPADITSLRERARAEAEANGTWGAVPTVDDAWADHVGRAHHRSDRANP